MRLRVLLVLLVVLIAGAAGGAYLLGAYHFRAAQAAFQRQDFVLTQQELDKCFKVWPRSSRAHLLAARTARRQHAYKQAEQHLADCERLDGKTDAVTLESVLLQVQQGHVTGAQDTLHDLITANSPDAP